MSLYNIRPERTPYSDRQVLRFGHWSLRDEDFTYSDGTMAHYRYIVHYATIMGYFYYAADGDGWQFSWASIGRGSVSDQNGMNRIIRGYGWRFLRAGYPRYEWVGFD